MSKPWIAFIFVLWTLALWIIAPYLYSFRTVSTSTIEVSNPLGLPPIKIAITEKRPILDWTGRLSKQYQEVTCGDKVLFCDVPGREVHQSYAESLPNASVKIDAKGMPHITLPKENK